MPGDLIDPLAQWLIGLTAAAGISVGLLVAIGWLTERSGRRPQAVEPLGMRIARLEHDCALEPPFEHPAGCPGCAPVLATIERERFYRERKERYAEVEKGILTARSRGLSPDEVREMRERWARGGLLGPMVLDEGAIWSPAPEPKAPPGTFRR